MVSQWVSLLGINSSSLAIKCKDYVGNAIGLIPFSQQIIAPFASYNFNSRAFLWFQIRRNLG